MSKRLLRRIAMAAARRPAYAAAAAFLAIAAATFAASAAATGEGLISQAGEAASAEVASPSASVAEAPGGYPAVSLDASGAVHATVIRNVDGDTVVCELDDGTSNYVRMLGVDAPESVAADASKNCAEGVEASDWAKATLPAGTEVWLSSDVSDVDRYGRWLRYVWTSQPSANPGATEVMEKMLNARAVAGGWAQARKYPPDTTLYPLLSAIGADASAKGAGVSAKWS